MGCSCLSNCYVHSFYLCLHLVLYVFSFLELIYHCLVLQVHAEAVHVSLHLSHAEGKQRWESIESNLGSPAVPALVPFEFLAQMAKAHASHVVDRLVLLSVLKFRRLNINVALNNRLAIEGERLRLILLPIGFACIIQVHRRGFRLGKLLVFI